MISLDATPTITITDVARQAQVSAGTVSNVLTGKRPVAAETRQRVLETIEALGYQPNLVARKLVNRSTATLGLVASGLEYYGPSRIVVGVERQASELGYTLILDLVHSPEIVQVEAVINDLLAQQVDGIIWSIPQIGDNRLWWERNQRKLRIPVVFLGSGSPPELPTIDFDNRNGGRLAVEHLLQTGRQHIGIITGPLDWWSALQRKVGWQDALTNAGLAPQELQAVCGDWGVASGEQCLYNLLSAYPALDAVFVCNDQMALGAMKAARQLGLRIPADLALVGYDDRPEAEYFYPPLTTVRQQLVEMGSLAVRELNRLIVNRQNRGGSPPPETLTTLLLQPQLVVRASSDPEQV